MSPDIAKDPRWEDFEKKPPNAAAPASPPSPKHERQFTEFAH